METYTLRDIKNFYHRYFLKWRAIDRILQSPRFAVAWEQATNKSRDQLLYLTYDPDILILKTWIRYALKETLVDCTTDKLRELASNHRIKDYAQLSKEELIKELRSKVNIHANRRQRLIKWTTGIDDELSITGRSSETSGTNKERKAQNSDDG